MGFGPMRHCCAGFADRCLRPLGYLANKWLPEQASNLRQSACKAGALPTELHPHKLVANPGIEPGAAALSRRCSTTELVGWKIGASAQQTRVLEECVGFEPTGRFRNHGLASRHLRPLVQHSVKLKLVREAGIEPATSCSKHVRYQLRYTRRKLEKPAPGGGTRARTADNPVKSRVLYRLSYAP